MFSWWLLGKEIDLTKHLLRGLIQFFSSFFILTIHGYSKCHEQIIWLKGVFSCVKDQIKDWCVCNRTNSVIFVCFCFVFLIFFWKNVSFCKERQILCGEQYSCLLLIRDNDIKRSLYVLLWKLAWNKKKERTKPILGKWFMTTQNEEQDRPQSNLYSVCINLFTPKISSVILLTICHVILMILVWRIRHWID